LVVRSPAVVALTLLLASCGGDPDFDSPRALADALAEAGLVCAEFREAPSVTRAEATADCRTSDGRDIGLQVHRDAELASTMVASANRTLAGTNRRALVHDGRWIVYVDEDRTATEVQDALGGEITQVTAAGG
jgi:hypothetical protein